MKNQKIAWAKSLTALSIFLMQFSTLAVGQQLDYLSKAPFYKNYKKYSIGDSKPALLPVAIDPKVYEEFFYKGRERVLQPLVDVMNSYIDSLGWNCVQIDSLTISGSPYIFVGSSEAETAPAGSETMRRELDNFPPMIIYVKEPSKEWRSRLEKHHAQNDFEYLIALWVGFAEYPKANKGLLKKKVVLGTNYEPEIRFLSAVDKPVEVLQLSGMLLNRKGEVLRAGAEGIIHEDTPFWAQIFDIKKEVDDKAIRQLIAKHRRDDLPGRPPAWRAALDTLVLQLSIDQ